MEIVIALLVGLYVGWKANEALMLITFRRMIEQLNLTNKDLVDLARRLGVDLPEQDAVTSMDDPTVAVTLPTLKIRLEQHAGQIYAYRKDNGEFLGQGASPQLLIERIGERMQDVRLLIDQDDGAELMAVK